MSSRRGQRRQRQQRIYINRVVRELRVWNGPRARHYDRAATRPIDTLEWAHAFEDPAVRVVKVSHVSGDVHVSTIWRGYDIEFDCGLHRAPRVFQTVVFVNDKRPVSMFRLDELDGYEVTSVYERQARIAHDLTARHVGRVVRKLELMAIATWWRDFEPEAREMMREAIEAHP